MRKLIGFALIFMSLNLSATENPTSVFFDGDFQSAKIKAGEEGKLFFVDFYADWCSPCKWMEETTFQDSEVKELLNENYIALKINIDEIEGFSIKQQFKVHILPTILIFNSEGTMVDRIEETLSARKLATLLNHHNDDKNKVVVQHSINSSPSMISNSQTESSKKVKKTLERINSSRNQTYRVQLGVFKEFENTYDMVSDLKSRFFDPVIVLNDYKGDQIVYKVMMGEFKTKEEAEGYRYILETEYKLKGIVK